MLLVIAGAVLAALGILAAALLVAAPLGLVAAAPGLSLWLLFPLFTLLGWALMVMGSRDPAVSAPTRWLALPLLLLALLAALGLMGSGAGLLQLGSGQPALWYVLLLGGLMGVVGSAAGSRRGAQTPRRSA